MADRRRRAVPDTPPGPEGTRAARAPTASEAGRALVGGRLSTDAGTTIGMGGFRYVAPPPDPLRDWSLGQLDERILGRITPSRLLEVLADLSPEFSRAVWDWLRFLNPGWEVVAHAPGTEDPEPRAQAVVDAFLARLVELYGTVDVPLGRLFLGAVLRGAFLAELVLDADGRTGVDLATPDPATVRFQRDQDPVRGQVWRAGQWQAGRFVVFDRPTIRYLPIDPFPGSPYGRPLVAPAVFAALFLLGLLHDLRRVVAQQGYPRLDLSIDLEQLTAMMPEEDRLDSAKVTGWAEQAVKVIAEAYAQLQPEDAFVHVSTISVNRPVGAVDASSLGGVDGLLKGLERMLTRALKTEPLLMSVAEGMSEASANRQWEVHAASVKSLQHYAESSLGWLLGLLCRATGIQAEVTVRFSELRASEMLRDEQTRRLANENAAFEYFMGWVSADEAALGRVGHPPVLQTPIATPSGYGTGAPSDVALDGADPGANRSLTAGPSTPGSRNGRAAALV